MCSTGSVQAESLTCREVPHMCVHIPASTMCVLQGAWMPTAYCKGQRVPARADPAASECPEACQRRRGGMARGLRRARSGKTSRPQEMRLQNRLKQHSLR